jgi:phosphomannomutase
MIEDISGEEKQEMLKTLEREVHNYLDKKFKEGVLEGTLYKHAKEKTMKNIREWVDDKFIKEHSPNVVPGLFEAVKQKRWEDIIFAFSDDMPFGTTGIRGQACFNQDDVNKFMKFGIDAPIIRGPNTINDVVLLIRAAGLAKYANETGLKSIAIGYDSRLNGEAFADLLAKLCIAYGIRVFLFDESCPYPELTFAIPTIGAELGILISASHNDKRYNGCKLSTKTGAQIDVVERDQIYNDYISKIKTSDLKLKPLSEAGDKLVFLGGSEKLANRDYFGCELVDMHTMHINHIKEFILDKKLLSAWADRMKIGYCAFYGAGYKSVPRILKELGLKNVNIVNEMNRLDGTFPCFHLYQQPDPGDTVAARIAVDQFKKEYSEKKFNELDVLVSTDPDADRFGLMIKAPEDQKEVYKQISRHPDALTKNLKAIIPGYIERTDYDWYLLTPDDALTLLFWYRLRKMKEMNNGKTPDVEKSFIAINHTTTDALTKLALKHGIGVVRAWVGFVFLSKCVEKVWDGEILDPIKDHMFLLNTIDMNAKRSLNLGVMEQSSGFTILGDRPLPGKYLGVNGHTRDKDGILTSALFMELVAYAKSVGKNIIELLDEHIYLDPDIGFFANYVESSPYWGQFEGPSGLTKKIRIFKKIDVLYDQFKSGKEIKIAGKKVVSIGRYATGKYDEIHLWKGFPDEGLQFYFDEEKLNYVIVRASGNSHCIRFHAQLHAKPDRSNLLETKTSLYKKAKEVVAELRQLCGA